MTVARAAMYAAGAGSVALSALVCVTPAPPVAPSVCPIPSAPEPVVVVAPVPSPDDEPVRLERVLDADYYVARMQALRAACVKMGGRDPVPMAVVNGVFMECWGAPVRGEEPRFWSLWVVYRGRVSNEPVPAFGRRQTEN